MRPFLFGQTKTCGGDLMKTRTPVRTLAEHLEHRRTWQAYVWKPAIEEG